MGKYNFDKVIDRKGTSCVKWDFKSRCSPKATENGLPFWIADMDFECAPPIIDALHKRIDHKIFGYSSSDTKEYKDAVCNWYKRRFDYEINRDSIFHSPGIVPAVAFLTRILTQEGDGIIIQKPVYYPFEAKVTNNNRRIVNNSLKLENGSYTIDFKDLEEKAKDESTKVFILCNPHNPVGRVWKKEELENIVDICKKNNLWIIADEIHSDIIRKGQKHTVLETVAPEYKDRIITCIAPSKTFNLAGMQLSNIIIHDKGMQEKWMIEIRDKFNVYAPNPFGIVSTIAAYNECEDWVDELNEYLDGNIEYIDKYLKENLPKVKLIPTEGTYLAWLDFREYGLSETELEDLMMTKAEVLFDEGYIFGEEGKGFERINVACPRVLLEECMDRIYKVFKQL